MIVNFNYLKYGTGASANLGSIDNSDAGKGILNDLIVAGKTDSGPPSVPAGVGVATPLAYLNVTRC